MFIQILSTFGTFLQNVLCSLSWQPITSLRWKIFLQVKKLFRIIQNPKFCRERAFSIRTHKAPCVQGEEEAAAGSPPRVTLPQHPTSPPHCSLIQIYFKAMKSWPWTDNTDIHRQSEDRMWNRNCGQAETARVGISSASSPFSSQLN